MISRPDIYGLLQKEIKVYDVLIDVGCAGLCDLNSFENSPFKKLIGIDKHFDTNDFGDYRKLNLTDKQLTGEERAQRIHDLYQRFINRYQIFTQDFFQYDFGTNNVSLIICNKVLHFYKDEVKFKLIERFHTALQKEGLLYIKLHHWQNPDNTDPNKARKFDDFTFQSLTNEEDYRFLVEPTWFIENLKKKYKLLPACQEVNEHAITVVIRK